MEFVPAICPNCGGKLQLPDDDKISNARCMYCNTDFIVKEAINLVSSQINLDTIFDLATEAEKANNYKEAYDYYTKILEFDINNYKAWFGKAVSAGWQSSLANLRLKEALNWTEHAIQLAPENEKEMLRIKAADFLNRLAVAIYKLSIQNFNIAITLDTYNKFITRMKIIISVYEKANQYKPDDIIILKNIVTAYEAYMKRYVNKLTNQAVFLTDNGYEEAKNKLLLVKEKIKAKDPNYNIGVPAHKKGACYVATMVYGSYDAPEVQVLREFRDRYLMNILVGRAFVRLYYFISPHIVKIICNNEVIKQLTKSILDSLVNKLGKDS